MRASSIYRGIVVSGLGIILAGCAVGLSHARTPTLPRPCWGCDDVQYFPPGTEFKLSREAAAMLAAEADADAAPTFPPGATFGVPTLAVPQPTP